MNYDAFIEEQIEDIRQTVGDGLAINALSGGVDSAVVTALGHRALGKRMKTFLVDNALMRADEPAWVVNLFAELQIPVELVDARADFLAALQGVVDPEKKRQAIAEVFYAKVFAKLVKKTQARFLMQGTILTDIEESVAGIKRQHNIISQLGIAPEQAYGYTVLEPLKTLRKAAVQQVAARLGLPPALSRRMPFPGPALAARIIGEVTEAKLAIMRKVTAIVEEELAESGAFQYLAALFEDRATGIRAGKREFGHIVVVRCVDSIDARTATATRLPWDKLERISQRITNLENINRCLYDLTPKPPATIEYI